MWRGRRATTCRPQVEAGHGCPITMTFAATPCLKAAAAISPREWLPKIHARVYDPRNVPAEREAGPDHRHGDDREAGRLGRARQYDARHSRSAPRDGGRLTNSSATSSSSRRRCATPSSCSRRRRAACPVFSSRAGAPTGPRTRCRSSGSSARWAMSPTPRARRSCAARSAGWSARRAGASRRSSRWWP